MKQGEIWLVNLDPTLGAEMKKTRPALIINDNTLGKLPLKIIVPITDWKEHYSTVPWMIKIESSNNTGLLKKSSADCFQIRSIAQERLIKKLGFVTNVEIEKIKIGITKVIGKE